MTHIRGPRRCVRGRLCVSSQLDLMLNDPTMFLSMMSDVQLNAETVSSRRSGVQTVMSNEFRDVSRRLSCDGLVFFLLSHRKAACLPGGQEVELFLSRAVAACFVYNCVCFCVQVCVEVGV